MVQKTFIHALSPAKAPLAGSVRRSSSVGDLSETTRSTRTRSCSRDSKDTNHDVLDSPRYQDNISSKDDIPLTPIFWAPQTPLSPLDLQTSVPPFLPSSA